MSTSKHIDKICIAAVSLSLVLTILFMCGGALGLSSIAKAMKYEATLFDASYVHKIDIVMDDWDTFIENCESEEYSTCTVVIDGSKHKNIAIRAKGNTSLSNVKSLGSQRYSFKLEFDHYETGKNCDGLDKLCLNNLIQDNTMMKDYLVYQMMNDYDVDSPLCSFAYITVNGEDWGLYLAVEGVEDSFLSRNYGSEAGELYKPDSMSFGGGRGNGKGFNMDDFDFDGQDKTKTDSKQQSDNTPQMPSGERQQSSFPQMPDGGNQQGTPPQMPGGERQQSSFPQMPDGGNQQGTPPQMPGGDNQQGGMPQMPDEQGQPGMDGSKGSDDVKLKYIDDDPDSYANIFDNAKTDVSKADEKRLISSLKALSEYSDLEDVLDMDEVLRYFVVHNFVVNGDSYTGSMIHNYYLHEKGGKLGMIPWDYNLAFGTFQGGNASSEVNDSIDQVLSDRPMQAWIFSDEQYTDKYHELFAEFIEKWFANGELSSMIEETAEMLRPYVEKDPTKFCTTEEFEKGVSALSDFVELRAEAVTRQLKGDSTAVNTDGLNLSDMGTMNTGMGVKDMPQGSNMGKFDISSLISITDKDGNKVEPATLIPDIASITSIKLSDGTTVDVQNADMRNLMQTDFTKIVSAIDKSGEEIDLSDYTISVERPFESGENGNSSQEGRGNMDRSERQTPDKEQDNLNDKRQMPIEQPNAPDVSMVTWILLGVSVVVLVGGLLIAAKKKY